MSLFGLLKGKGPSGFGYNSRAREVVEGLDLSSKSFLITGSNSGLGLETARALADCGATVLTAARSKEKADQTAQSIGDAAIGVVCELSEPASVRACVREVKDAVESLDGIICNAGIMALPQLTLQHGYEAQFFTNHIGHAILVLGLLDHLASDGRVVMVSSAAHQAAPKEGVELDNLDGAKGYGAWRAYGQSKLANLLFARRLAVEFQDTEKVAVALHPGVIDTNLGRHLNPVLKASYSIGSPLFMKDAEQGASTQTWAAAHPDASHASGEYLVDCNVARSSAKGRDMELAARLWERTHEILESLT